jgi:hypothetical protein
MKCRCQLNILLDPKRNPRALSELLMTLSRCASAGAASALIFHLSAGKDQSALSMLLQALPVTATGFSLAPFVPSPATAGVLIAAAAGGGRIPVRSYDGDLLEHFDLGAGLHLIDRCVTSDPAAMRGAAAYFFAHEISFAGAPVGAVGGIKAADIKSSATKRTGIVLLLEWEAERADPRAAKEALRRVAAETGLPWSRAKIDFVMGHQAAAFEDERFLYRGAVILSDAVARIGADLRKRQLAWRDFPLLRTHQEATRQRFALNLGAVNFSAVVKAFMKRHRPTFAFRKYEDGCEFVESITEERALVLRFAKDRSLMGKAYSLELGVRLIAGPSAGALLSVPFSYFLDHDEIGWIYGTVEELEATLAEVGRMLDLLLENWKASCVAFDPAVPETLQLMPQSGAVTLHEAVRIAASALAPLDLGLPSFIRAMLGTPYVARGRLRMPRDMRGLDADGRLRSGQAWMVEFANRSTGRLMRVTVPYEGHFAFEMSYRLYLEEPPKEFGGLVVRHIDGAPDRDGLIMLPPEPRYEAAAFLSEIEQTVGAIPQAVDVIAFADGIKGRDYREKNPYCWLDLQFRSQMLVGAPNSESWELTYHGETGADPQRLMLKFAGGRPFKLLWASDGPPHGQSG